MLSPRTSALSAWALVLLLGCSAGPTTRPQPDAVVSFADIAHVVELGGRLVPREEVFVRPLVAGLLADVRVRVGQRVKKGQHLATVRIIADPVTLAEARAAVRRAATTLASATRELTRVRAVTGGLGLTAREIAQAEDVERLARSELEAAEERARLIAEGVTGAQRAGVSGGRSTQVLAPVEGTVLAVPVAVGDFVTDSNSYRDGTALAVLADMGALLFKGYVEEVYVGRLKLGMEARVRVGALGGDAFPGTLRFIAPRASVELASASPPTLPNGQPVLTPLTASTAGTTRFEIWIELTDSPTERLRAGYTAAAELLLDKREHALSVPESALRFKDGKALAEVRTGTGSETRNLTLGLSDGVRIEVLGGLREGERVIVPAQ